MDEQLNLFPKTQKELGQEREADFLEAILPDLKNIAAEMKADPNDITYKVGESYSSAKFRSYLIARVKLRGKKHYVSLPELISDAFPKGLPLERIRSDPGYPRADFEALGGKVGAQELIKRATRLAIERVPKEFDCCSRYEACSNAKACVNTIPGLSLLCGYRKILLSGRIFYGKNRNIL